MFICLIIPGEFESFFILLKGRSLITFPKVVADLFFSTQSNIFINPKISYIMKVQGDISPSVQKLNGITGLLNRELLKQFFGCP